MATPFYCFRSGRRRWESGPKRRTMELLQLRYFLTAAEYEHMTRAAEHLQIAQPALSQAIHRLEMELGVPLFERKNRSIELNESGRLLQKRLIPIIRSLDRIPKELKEGQDVANHTIHLKILAASSLITNCIIAYRALHPDVNFQLYQSDNHEEFDLCVTAVRSDEPYVGENYSVMLEEDLYLAVPAKSRYGDRVSVNLLETRNDGYICLAGSRPIRRICNSYFAEADFVPNIIFESDTTESVRNLIAAGLGIGFWPQYSWGALSTKHVVLLPIRDQVCRRCIILINSPQGKHNPILAEFCAFLTDNAKWL